MPKRIQMTRQRPRRAEDYELLSTREGSAQPVIEHETDAEALERIRRARTLRALAAAPDLAFHLRWDAHPIDGRTERGWLPEQRTPLLTEVTDSADALYVTLHEWVIRFAAALDAPAPDGYLWRRDDGEVLLGFRAATSPELASSLVYSATRWLQVHDEAIAALPEAEAYQDAVSDLVWRLRGAAGASGPRKPPAIATWATRPCPECGGVTVRAEYFGEPMAAAVARGERLKPVALDGETEEQAMNVFLASVLGVGVRCAACGWAPALRPSQIARWLA